MNESSEKILDALSEIIRILVRSLQDIDQAKLCIRRRVAKMLNCCQQAAKINAASDKIDELQKAVWGIIAEMPQLTVSLLNREKGALALALSLGAIAGIAAELSNNSYIGSRAQFFKNCLELFKGIPEQLNRLNAEVSAEEAQEN